MTITVFSDQDFQQGSFLACIGQCTLKYALVQEVVVYKQLIKWCCEEIKLRMLVL